MKSKTTKLAAAAVIVIGISVAAWLSSNTNTPEVMSSFTLLSKASAAEQTLFYGTTGIIHIVNEIVLYPSQEHDAGELLSDLEADVTQDKNITFIKSWLSYQWVPVYSLAADGKTREHKLKLAGHINEIVTISDLAWYDPVTGRFARELKTGDQVLFANAYDGESVYFSDGGPQVKQEAVTGEFKVPGNPADFLGIAAGIRESIPREHYPPIQNVITETLEDGTEARIYKMGFADPWGKVDTYFLFKIDTNTNVINEIECVVEGRTSCVHRRVVAETVDSPGLSWNLSELSEVAAEQSSVNVDTTTGADTVTIQQMAQRATFPVYIFAEDPSWTSDRKIYDLPDEMSAPARFFAATYRAKDGREIVLTQGESFNRYFTAIFNKTRELGKPISWPYVSQSGFKALQQDDKQGEMWWTEFALKSSGFEPTANRVGYILQSPANSFMLLAINGPISDQELQSLIDSMIPAEEYVPSSIQHPNQ